MASTLFNVMGQQGGNLMQQIQQIKSQFGPNADPKQIIQQGIQSGRFTQEQVNAAYQQMQQLMQMFPFG